MLQQIPENRDIQGELTKVNGRLDHLEDMVSDILESGREMDENLTSQLDDVRYELSLQHETLKKMKRSACTRTHKLSDFLWRSLALGFCSCGHCEEAGQDRDEQTKMQHKLRF